MKTFKIHSRETLRNDRKLYGNGKAVNTGNLPFSHLHANTIFGKPFGFILQILQVLQENDFSLI